MSGPTYPRGRYSLSTSATNTDLKGLAAQITLTIKAGTCPGAAPLNTTNFRVRVTDSATTTTKTFQLDYLGVQVNYTP